MRRKLSFLLLTFCLSVPTMKAADLLILSNNASIGFVGDSLWASDSDGVGARFVSFFQAGEACLHPTRTIFVYNGSGSGRIMDTYITSSLPASVGFFGYQSNNNQHVLFINATDNGALTSNQMFLATSNCCLFPGISSLGDFPLSSSTGWMSTHTFQVIPLGHPPNDVSDGSLSASALSGGQYRAGLLYGFAAVDTWVDRVLTWTNDIVNSNAVNIMFTDTGHIIDGGDWDEYIAMKRKLTASDTNVANSMIDFATALVVDTNNCVVSNITKTATSITFDRGDLALAPPYAVPHADGSLTNDTRPAFNLDPINAVYFNFGMGVTNLPSGNYNVYVDGHWIATQTSAQLAARMNLFTNNVPTNPLWLQREEVWLRVLDWRFVDRKTMIPRSASFGVGEVSVGSFSFQGMTLNKRGDDLIAHLNAKMTDVQTNFLPQYSQSIYSAALPTNHTWTISAANSYNPAPFR